MSKWSKLLFISIFIVGLSFNGNGQKIENIDGIRTIHNEKGGIWKNELKVELQLIRTIGGLDEEDENLAFNSPSDIALDSSGNMYILDRANNRIQKLNPEGEFLAQIGQRGQGPGEFGSPASLTIDENDNLYVFDTMNRRIQIFSPDGEVTHTIKFTQFAQNHIRLIKDATLVMGGIFSHRDFIDESKPHPKLLTVIGMKGDIKKKFGEIRDYKDANVNTSANWFSLDVDKDNNICISFWRQNRIEKYDSEGKLLWTADRVLNYDTKVHDKGDIKRDEKGTMIQGPTMNHVSTGIAADGSSRIWVATFNRQMTKEEQGSSVSVGGRTIVQKEPKISKMDVFKLEIFSHDGLLLGEIPLDHRAHGIRIFDDNLFIWDMQDTKYYHYKIIEK